MWKLYNRTQNSGSSSAFWDHTWDEGGNFIGGPRTIASAKTREQCGACCRRICRRIALFLEGGCGPANWLRYYHARGYRGLGVDFAPKTVARVKALDPTVDIRLGDVTACPVDDGSVHT